MGAALVSLCRAAMWSILLLGNAMICQGDRPLSPRGILQVIQGCKTAVWPKASQFKADEFTGYLSSELPRIGSLKEKQHTFSSWCCLNSAFVFKTAQKNLSHFLGWIHVCSRADQRRGKVSFSCCSCTCKVPFAHEVVCTKPRLSDPSQAVLVMSCEYLCGDFLSVLAPYPQMNFTAWCSRFAAASGCTANHSPVGTGGSGAAAAAV